MSGAREKNGRFYAHGRFGKSERYEYRVPSATTLDDAEARSVIMTQVSEGLVAVGRRDLVRATVKQIAEARTAPRLEAVRKAAKAIIDGAIKAGHARDITIRQWGERYTSGELTKLWPDHVKAKDWDDDISRLKAYVYPHVGNVPVTAFTFDHASEVLSKLPAEKVRRDATRRHVAQIMGRLMHLAVFPGRLIAATPLPRGWLPKIADRRMYSCLYPREESLLLAHEATPVVFRLFCGVLNREGMRLSELLDSEWSQWNLDEGTFTTAKTKTRDPRFWVLAPDVAEAMRAWRDHVTIAKPPFATLLAELRITDRVDIAEAFRSALRAAGVDRKELFVTTEYVGQLRAHDMRATFVTIALAQGKGDTWIRDRTAHKSTSMIDRYRRTARQFSELKLTKLEGLTSALGWWKGGGKVVVTGTAKSTVTPRNNSQQGLRGSNPRPADLESDDRDRRVADHLENPVETDVAQRRDLAFHQSSATPNPTDQDGARGTTSLERKPSIARAKGGAVGARLEDERGTVLARTDVAEGDDISDVIDRLKSSAEMGGRRR